MLPGRVALYLYAQCTFKSKSSSDLLHDFFICIYVVSDDGYFHVFGNDIRRATMQL